MGEIRLQAVESKEQRTIVGRLLPGTDLVGGIEKICLDNRIDNGIIVSAIGSLKQANIVYAVPDPSNKIGIKYCAPTIIDGPLELLPCQGTIGLTTEKKLSIHLHGLMSDAHMKVYGGHFVEGGNIVLATVEIMIVNVPDIQVVRGLDDETGFPLFKFYKHS